MLELVTSKIAMMMAAIIILVSVLGIYAIQRNQAIELELKSIADKIAGTIENLNALHGETKVIVAFDEGDEDVHVKPYVDGKNYEIMITCNKVFITQDDRHYTSDITGSIHLWVPLSNTYNQTQIQYLDDENRKLEFKSGQDFEIERKLIEIGGEDKYMTFVYLREV